ncbi:MAG: hypothetical protein Q8N23_02710 [Archangium sp.]|nr:hypothetical protein [Archangium sp.]MDP3151553.1 hypothetical protein [Archangium sp.]MDP3572140.1 hypothetical protein [Archangium sp.]
MSTRGHGLWDNETSIAEVPGLIRVTPSKDLWHLLASWGLRLWFGQCEPREFARAVERKSKDVVKLPKPVFDALSNIAQRPDSFRGHRSRRQEHTAILGGYCGGFRMEALFTLPETREIVQKVADRCANRLDGVFKAKQKAALTTDPLIELGVLLEFTNIGIFQEAPRVEKWKKGFAEMNALTTDDRGYYDEYATRVDKLFTMLKSPLPLGPLGEG